MEKEDEVAIITVYWQVSILLTFPLSHDSSLFPWHFLVENASLTPGKHQALVRMLAASAPSRGFKVRPQMPAGQRQ